MKNLEWKIDHQNESSLDLLDHVKDVVTNVLYTHQNIQKVVQNFDCLHQKIRRLP
jgi:hypothetical protein